MHGKGEAVYRPGRRGGRDGWRNVLPPEAILMDIPGGVEVPDRLETV